MAIELRFSARSHVGMVRKGNEDSGYASAHLLAIADGMGGHAAGEVASAATLRAVLELLPEGAPWPAAAANGADQNGTGLGGPDTLLRDAIARAGLRLRELISGQPELEGMGTTLTALLQLGDRVAIAQVGDSRGYLLRNGVLEQVTHDQTFVQSLVDQGRISQDDARTHPQRSLLLQALDGRVEVEPVIALRAPQVGDRYLLCSDGLSGVLSEATMREVLMVGTPDEAADQLVNLSLRGGAPDNVTCVVADVVDIDDTDDELEPQTAVLVGAAADETHQVHLATDQLNADERVAVAGDRAGDGASDGDGDGDSSDDDDEPRRSRGFRLLLPVLLLVLVGVAAFFGYRWTQTQYYVGADAGQVAIFRGVPQHLVGRSLSKVVEPTDMHLTDLPTFAQDQVNSTISASSIGEAHRIVARLQQQAAGCLLFPQPDGCPAGLAVVQPTPSSSPSATATATTRPSPSPSNT